MDSATFCTEHLPAALPKPQEVNGAFKNKKQKKQVVTPFSDDNGFALEFLSVEKTRGGAKSMTASFWKDADARAACRLTAAMTGGGFNTTPLRRDHLWEHQRYLGRG